MSQGPDLPRPIYPDGQAPKPTGQPAPSSEEPASPTPSPTPSPTRVGDSGSGSGGGSNPMKLLLIGLAAVVVLAGAGFGLVKVLGGSDDDPDKNSSSNTTDPTHGTDGGDPSAEASEVAADALSNFPQSVRECFAGELEQRPDLLSELAPVAANFGYTFDDTAIAEEYADAMTPCVELDDVADALAVSAADAEGEACIRANVSAWSEDELHDFIRSSVDATDVEDHKDKSQALLTC